jgi:aspartate 1-decarboxylase
MLRNLLISKIHRARVTGADVDYVGSITIDSELMRDAGILPWEQVHVADITNGARLETYAIPGEGGSGTVQLNGAAARIIHPGDLVIIMAYAWLSPEEIDNHHPRIILVDDRNRVLQMIDAE